MRLAIQSFLLAVVLFLSVSQSPGAAAAVRSVPIPIKIVIIGFDESQVDASYLSWQGASSNLPASITNVDLITGNTTGVVFHPQYSVVYASSSFKQSFLGYLNSISNQTKGNNPWFSYYQHDTKNTDYYNRVPSNIAYVVYDANSVEEWLWEHAQDLGGYPDNGWTVIVAYLPQLPSISWSDVKAFEKTNGATSPTSKPHYYGINHTDVDLGYTYRYRDFMNAWGGHHRMWFVDLSAGPVRNSQWEDLPLQVALGDNNIDTSSSFGKRWLTEYISDYVYQATYNFVAQNFVYYPQYAPKYQIDVYILDDRTSEEKRLVPVQSTVNKDVILKAYQELVPYSNVVVNLNFPDLPGPLRDIIGGSYKYTDSWLMGADFAHPERYGIVDLRPVYKYMLDNFGSFESNSPTHIATSEFNPNMVEGTVIIPVFAFAFSSETYFSYTYKWFIGDTDWETGALLGIALPEAAFVSLNQWVFTRGNQITPPQPNRGEGFTQTIIHEVGHEFGLMHPHQYGDIGDFITSPMGYFTDDYKFGQIDKDSVQRAHVDEIRMETERLLSQFPAESAAAEQIRSKLSEADSAYSQMKYDSAIAPVLVAYQLARQQVSPQPTQVQSTTGTAIPPSVPTTAYLIAALIAGIIVGIVLGFAIPMVLKRARTQRQR